MTGLRGYQDLLVNATTPQLWREGYRRLVWVLPTGAGKTRCAQTLIARMRATDWCAVYYFAHTTELVTQPASGFASRDVRFGFLKAPRSTVLQPGPVHGGVTADPGRQLERLLEQLVG